MATRQRAKWQRAKGPEATGLQRLHEEIFAPVILRRAGRDGGVSVTFVSFAGSGRTLACAKMPGA